MSYRWILILALIPGILPVSEGESAPLALPPQDAPEAVVEEEEPAPPALAIPQGYQYDPRGRRDPFVNPVPPPPQAFDPLSVVPAVRPLGLPGVLLNEALLVGVVTSEEPSMNVVVVIAPGNRTFFARAGDELFDAVVTEISPNAIVFEVKPLGGQPEPEQREQVVRTLNATPGE
jgi:hypothetical protein